MNLLKNILLSVESPLTGFEAKTPDVIDADIRLCYFFSQIEKESLEKLMSKECKYVIRNLLGGEGSAYYH